jgi:hypothetical protein
MLSAKQLRSVANLLSDPGSAANAAGILAREARERGCLVAGSDCDGARLGFIRRAAARARSADHVGLVGPTVAETDKAWRVETPNAEPAWLPKSQREHHGEDVHGRTILILQQWLVHKIRLQVTS